MKLKHPERTFVIVSLTILVITLAIATMAYSQEYTGGSPPPHPGPLPTIIPAVGPDGSPPVSTDEYPEDKPEYGGVPSEEIVASDGKTYRFPTQWIRMARACNEYRASQGRPPLKLDMHLMQSAGRHARRQANTGRIWHPGGPFSENVAMNGRSVRQLTIQWINSGGHRSNMLGNHTHMGVAVYQNNGFFYGVQRFR